MSSHPISADTDWLRQAVSEQIRELANVTADPDTGAVTYHFEPDLSSTETTLLGDLERLGETGLSLSAAEYTSIRAEMAPLRALKQMTRNEFMALSAAERDRMLYDALVATTTVLRLVFRDE